VADFDSAVITRTIQISQTIPVVFDLKVDSEHGRQANQGCAAEPGRDHGLAGRRWSDQRHGQPSLAQRHVPAGPSHHAGSSPPELPVRMDVLVSIPLKETELGSVTGQLKDLLTPYTKLLSDLLHCPQASP